MTEPTIRDLLEDLRRSVYRASMDLAMAMNVRLIGVPYGPALCEISPPLVRGLIPEVLRMMNEAGEMEATPAWPVRLGPGFYRPRPGSVLPITPGRAELHEAIRAAAQNFANAALAVHDPEGAR